MADTEVATQPLPTVESAQQPDPAPESGPNEEELKAALKKTALLEDTDDQILFSCNICYDVSTALLPYHPQTSNPLKKTNATPTYYSADGL